MGDPFKAFDGLIGDKAVLLVFRAAHAIIPVHLDLCKASRGLVLLHRDLLKADAQGDHDHDGGSSDHDAKDRKTGPQLSSSQIVNAHPEQIREFHRPFPLSSFCV